MEPTDTVCLRTLIVDDERLARENLRQLLAAHGEVAIVGEAHNAEVAERMIADVRPDLVFLDIQMPGRSGFDLLEGLVSPPPIIFVTAFDNFAIRAFEVNALDYLLKPVEPQRLAKAIERMGRRETAPSGGPGMLRWTDRAFLDTGRQAVFLSVADIAAITAEGNYTHVLGAHGEDYLVRVPLHGWEARLPADTFVILDRSLLINRSHIRRYALHARGVELYLGDIAQPFHLGRVGLRRFKENILAHPTVATSL